MAHSNVLYFRMLKITTVIIALVPLLFFLFLASEVFAQQISREAAITYSPDPNLLPILIVMSILTIFTNTANLLKKIKSAKKQAAFR